MLAKIARLFGLEGEDPRVRRQRLVLDAFIVGCTLLTAGAMYSGFASLGEVGAIESWLAICLTLAIAASLTYAIHNFFYAASGKARLGWFACWSGLAFVSIVMGYGLYFDLLSAKTMSREHVSRGVSAAVEPMVGYKLAYADLSASATDLATYSRGREAQEQATGGTCGGAPQPNNGPRSRLRSADAAMFTSYADHFARQATRLGTAVAAAEAISSDYQPARHQEAVRGVERAFAESRYVATDSRLRQWKAALAERSTKADRPMTDPQTGATFSCPDPALDERMRGAAEVDLPALPEALPEMIAPTHAASVQRGLGIVTGTVAFERRLDLLPFLLGAIVDALLAFFIFTKAARFGAARDGDQGPEALRAFLDEAPILGTVGGRLDEGLAAPRWEFVALLDRWSAMIGRRHFLVVPARPDSGSEAARLRALVALLRLTHRFDHKLRMRADRLPRPLRVCGPAVAPDEEVDVFQIPSDLIARLESDSLRSWMADQNRDDDWPRDQEAAE